MPTAVLALLAGSQVDVRSATNCPSGDDIAARLLPLLPGDEGGTPAARDLAQIHMVSVGGDGEVDLFIELANAAGVPMGERRLSGRAGCAELAEAVAVVLAAWESAPRLSPASAADGQGGGGAGPGAPPVLTASSSANAAGAHGRFRGAVGAGGGAALVGGLAGALAMSLELGSATSRWQLEVDGLLESSRQVELAGGQVDWRHSDAGIGLGWRAVDSRLLLVVEGALSLGWATLAGHGYSPGREQSSFEVGLGGGLRLGWAWRRWQLWAEGRPRWWLQGPRPRVSSPPTTADLPSLDVTICLGASFVAFP